MIKLDTKLVGATVALLLFSGVVWGGEPSASVTAVQRRWDEVMFATAKPQREHALEALATQAGAARTADSRDANALIWEGIVLSSWAGEKGGIGALNLVKRARADFEQAIALDPTAMEGSAYTSLGSLYYQVPGWPLGFGNDDKAREMLLKGLKVNPNGIDANYFYGDFLRDQKNWKGAEAALMKAVAAPARPGRELADQGRRKEAQAMLGQVRRELAGH
jgi:tetratricopeptide (TPR) repeat protein